ncbi:PAP2 family protein, partial [Ostertagia ostertagi]
CFCGTTKFKPEFIILLFVRGKNSADERDVTFQGSNRLANYFTTTTLLYLKYLISFAVCTFLMEFLKCFVGRLRPHFLAVCQPDWSRMDCTDKEYIPVSETFCTNPDTRRIRTARTSFPSGHTAAAFHVWIFLVIYLCRMARITAIPSLYKTRNILLAIFTGWTGFTAITRITDYWHYPSDVLEELHLKEACKHFEALFNRVKKKEEFVDWIHTTYCEGEDCAKPMFVIDSISKLREIADHIKAKVHVDCFLYDDHSMQAMIAAGKLQRRFCVDCGSRNIKDLNFISHSLAHCQLEFIFTQLVPLKSQPEGFRVLDIGSRLGAVIYAASLYGCGKVSVTGVELNEELVKLQEEVISNFNL